MMKFLIRIGGIMPIHNNVIGNWQINDLLVSLIDVYYHNIGKQQEKYEVGELKKEYSVFGHPKK